MGKFILITASLLISSGVWAEQRVCLLEYEVLSTLKIFEMEKYISDTCSRGDILSWHMFVNTSIAGHHLEGTMFASRGKTFVAEYCHQEKEITV